MHIFNMLGNYNDTLCIEAEVKCLWEPCSCGKGKEIKQQFTNALFIGLCIDCWTVQSLFVDLHHYYSFYCISAMSSRAIINTVVF